MVKKKSKKISLSLSLSTHHILHLSTESDTVLEHASQRDGIGETQTHQTSIESGGQGDGGEGHGGKEDATDEVNSHSKPPGGHQVQVPALRVLILEPGHDIRMEQVSDARPKLRTSPLSLYHLHSPQTPPLPPSLSLHISLVEISECSIFLMK